MTPKELNIDSELLIFAYQVLRKECTENWVIKWTNYDHCACWHEDSIIEIGLKCNSLKQRILHQISHIKTKENKVHSSKFWEELETMLKKYLNVELNNEDKLLKEKELQ